MGVLCLDGHWRNIQSTELQMRPLPKNGCRAAIKPGDLAGKGGQRRRAAAHFLPTLRSGIFPAMKNTIGNSFTAAQNQSQCPSLAVRREGDGGWASRRKLFPLVPKLRDCVKTPRGKNPTL